LTKQSKKAKPIKQRSLSVCDEYVKRHHLGLMLCAIPWPAPWRALFIAFCSYVLSLIAAAFCNFTIVVGSFLHIWQVTFSITIFLATWLGYSILASIKPWLTSAKRSLRISGEDFRDLSQSTDHEIVDDTSVGPLSRIALRNCIFMLVTIASAMPGVAYVGFSFGNRQVILIVTVFGMILPTLGIALSFFAPNYYLSQILSKARYARVTCFPRPLFSSSGPFDRGSLESTSHDSRQKFVAYLLT
jgi:hypothetical protein